MPKIDVLNMNGQKVETLELNDSIFNTEVNKSVLHEVVKNYLANQRQGTHSAKTRAEVRGGGKKPFKQKGTGRARQGTIRAPHFVGGGVAFAKKPRDYSYKLPKKVKRLALRSALSAKFQANELIVLDALTIEAPKTKVFVDLLSNINAGKKSTIYTGEHNVNMYKSARNIQGVKASFVGEINVYDLLNCNTVVMTKDAIQKLEEVYA